ncbi:MAG: hypothetical protein ABFR97_02535 [Thermodesulfobacteriota bacterium]
MNLQSVINLAGAHPVVTAVIALALGVFAAKKPKEFFKLMAFVAVLALALFIFYKANDSMLTGAESSKKIRTKTLESDQIE